MKKIYLLLVLLLSNMTLYACPPPNIPDEYQVRCDPLDMSADGELMLFHDMSPETQDKLDDSPLRLVFGASDVGLINRHGRVIIPPKYLSIQSLSVQHKNVIVNQRHSRKKVYSGMMDRRLGHVVLPLEYDDVWLIGDNKAIVEQAGRYAIFDEHGRAQTPFRYSLIEFGEQKIRKFATAPLKLENRQANPQLRYGVMNGAGQELLPDIYVNVAHLTREITLLHDEQGQSWFVNPLGQKWQIAAGNEIMWVFEEWVLVKNTQGQVALLNHAGQEIIPFGTFDKMFLETKSKRFLIQQNGQWGLADLTGKILIKPQYESVFHRSIDFSGWARFFFTNGNVWDEYDVDGRWLRFHPI